jgi:hypothetical protein
MFCINILGFKLIKKKFSEEPNIKISYGIF